MKIDWAKVFRGMLWNSFFRIVTIGITWLSAKGIIPVGYGLALTFFITTILVNVGITVWNRIIARWHTVITDLLPPGSLDLVDAISDATGSITKIKQMVQGTQEQAVITAAAEAPKP